MIQNQTSCLLSVYDALVVQYCVGKAITSCKSKYYTAMLSVSPKDFAEYQNQNPTPAVVFYNTLNQQPAFYIVNHNHLSYSLALAPIHRKYKYLKICIIEDYRTKYNANQSHHFWDALSVRGMTYLYDSNHRYLDPNHHMPMKVLQLTDDPYRSLSRYVLDYFGYIFCAHKNERHDGLNFSQCYGKQLQRWQKQYKYFGIALAWSNFYRDRLAVEMRTLDTLNIKQQMHTFRRLLPIAMNLSLNAHDNISE
eukprot:409767_1